MAHVFLAGEGTVWVQPSGPNTAPDFLGCHLLGDLTEPMGDVTLLYCPDPSGPNRFEVAASYQGVPGVVTTSITTDLRATADALESIKCPVPLYILLSQCGRKDVFANYDRGFSLINARITSRGLSKLVAKSPDDQGGAEQSFDISADEVHRIYKVTAARQSVAETAALMDIAFCNEEMCQGDCGARQELGEAGHAVAKFIVGDSPASKADMWNTADGGTTWASPWATEPFAASVDIAAVECFDVGRDTTRILVANGTSDAGPAEVAYSDNGGVTWTLVTVGAVNTQYFYGANSLFALDMYHIWACTATPADGAAPYIYFSADGGVTWTAQESGAISAVGSWLAIHFADETYGLACGNNNLVANTTDGGSTWNALTGPTGQAAAHWVSCSCIDRYHYWIGCDASGATQGSIYYSIDSGVTWALRAFTGSGVGRVNGIRFLNSMEGWLISDTAAPVGRVLRTINGGNDWENITVPTNAGFNAVTPLDVNTCYVVGNASGGTAVILKISK